MSIGINELFEMLNCNSSEEIQKEGIIEGLKVKNISIFMQPIEDKGVWENCARIISRKPDNEIENYLEPLLEWLQDANWPGYDIVYKRIRKMKSELITNTYFATIKKAITQKKEKQGDAWLVNLLSLLNNNAIYETLNKKEKHIIKRYIRKYKNRLKKLEVWYETVEKNHFPFKLECIEDGDSTKANEIFIEEYRNTFNKIKHLLGKNNEKLEYSYIFESYLHNTIMLLPNEILRQVTDIKLLTLGKVFPRDYDIIKNFIENVIF